MKYNKNFNKYLKRIYTDMKDIKLDKKVEISIGSLRDLLFPNFKKVFDCIVISGDSISNLKRDFDATINYLGDINYYEIYDTEVLINSYLENENYTKEELLYITIMVIKAWKYKLNMITDKKIRFIISFDENRVTLRFHQIRDDGYEWLESDLDSYDGPIGYITC